MMINLHWFTAQKNVHFADTHDLEMAAFSRCETFDDELRVIYLYAGLERPTEFPFIFNR